MFPGGGPAVDFYRADANRQGGRVLELGCGTGHKLTPIASDGHPCVGLDFSPDMLAEAQRKANERGVAVEWMQGDMRAFDLGRTFDFVFFTANSLLHLHAAEDLVSCFRSVWAPPADSYADGRGFRDQGHGWIRVTQYGVSGVGGVLNRALGRYNHGPNAATVVGVSKSGLVCVATRVPAVPAWLSRISETWLS
jgi:SAM-dependent methyltransferase